MLNVDVGADSFYDSCRASRATTSSRSQRRPYSTTSVMLRLHLLMPMPCPLAVGTLVACHPAVLLQLDEMHLCGTSTHRATVKTNLAFLNP